jgi:hypothetical protein
MDRIRWQRRSKRRRHTYLTRPRQWSRWDEAAWQEYVVLIELYRFYLDLFVRAMGAYFVVSGGVVTLVLANAREEPIVGVALGIPILMSLLLSLAAWLARPRIDELHDGMRALGYRAPRSGFSHMSSF